MKRKKRILLKLSGEILLSATRTQLCATQLTSVISQIKQLYDSHQFAIVIGGGNFFRGSQHGASLGLRPATGHSIGMLATMMNSLIVHDLCKQQNLDAVILSASYSPQIAAPISTQTIETALSDEQVIIFAGGTGNPYFTTDTSAVLRGLQIGADEVWKGTNIDGVYNADPRKNSQAHLIKRVSYSQALDQKYGVMDLAAYAMAQEHSLPIRVFDITHKEILIALAQGQDIGSIIS